MAGETTKTAGLTSVDAGTIVTARDYCGTPKETYAHVTFASGELETADVKRTLARIPWNARILKLEYHHAALDSGGSEALVLDIGVGCSEATTTFVSGTGTKRAAGATLDIDLLVDGDDGAGDDNFATASATFTAIPMDAATFAPNDVTKMVWELLGYDAAPLNGHAEIQIAASTAAASAVADAALDLIVHYVTD